MWSTMLSKWILKGDQVRKTWGPNYSWVTFFSTLLFLLLSTNFASAQIEGVPPWIPPAEHKPDTLPMPQPTQPMIPTMPSPLDKPSAFKLPDGYSVHKSPPLIDGEAIPVDFSMLIFNVFDIRELQEEFSLEVNYKLYWSDVRLQNWTRNIDPGQKFATISTSHIHRVWHPDIFIDHLKRVTQPQLISSASSLRVYKDGSLRWTARILLVVTCRMDFHYYPADTQSCNVTMKSFAFSTRQINLRWRDGIGALLAKSIDVHNFDIALETYPDFLQTTKSNNFTALTFGLKLRRKLSYHVIQTYIPSTMFTIVSWLSHLVPPESTPGRMAICVTTLLTVTAMFGAVKQNTPNVSYIKALDLWMILCIFFIFLSLAEFCVILKLRSMKEKPKPEKASSSKKKKEEDQDVEKGNHLENDSNSKPSSSVLVANQTNNTRDVCLMTEPVVKPPVIPPPAPGPPSPPKPSKYFVWATKIEKWSPKLIPLLFASLICCYWPYILIMGDYFSLNVTPDMYYTTR